MSDGIVKMGGGIIKTNIKIINHCVKINKFIIVMKPILTIP